MSSGSASASVGRDTAAGDGTAVVLKTTIVEYKRLAGKLFDSMLAELNPGTAAAEQQTAVEAIAALVGLDAKLQHEAQKVLDDQHSQHEVNRITGSIADKDGQLKQIETALRKCEEKLVESLDRAKSKLESIRNAEKAELYDTDLLAYAHQLSVAFGTDAPQDWRPGDDRRPFPNVREMGSGALAALNEAEAAAAQ